MIGFNGGLIGVQRTPVLGPSIPGVWSANEQIAYWRNGIWATNVKLTTTQNYMNSNMTTPVSGTAPLTGSTPFWIDITGATSFSYAGQPLQYAMDGALGTYVYWAGSDYPAGGITRARLELVPRICSAPEGIAKVRIYSQGIGGSYASYSFRLLDANKTIISGTTVTASNSTTPAWTSVPVSGFPYYLEMVPSGPNPRIYLSAIEINDQILIDT